jgi:hypothetical protein
MIVYGLWNQSASQIYYSPKIRSLSFLISKMGLRIGFPPSVVVKIE